MYLCVYKYYIVFIVLVYYVYVKNIYKIKDLKEWFNFEAYLKIF